MSSGLLSNFNVAVFGNSYPRAVRVKQQYQPLQWVQALFSHKSFGTRESGYTGINMTATSGDLMVDSLVSGYRNLFGIVKPRGVSFSDRSRKGAPASHRGDGGRGCLVYNCEQRYNSSGFFSPKGLATGRAFASFCHSDGSVSVEQLSSVAVSDEQRSQNHSSLKLLSGACYMPHPAKEETGGEDAHFICADEQVIGVSDGVGGWADVGVNAGDYARELMSNSVKAIREVPPADIDPLQVLEKAHGATNAMGSSTACIIALKNQDLHAINLGDSGFIIVRDGCTVFESPVQQHGFNFTYQLEKGNRADVPSSGQVFKIPVVPGDVVVAGSDGLFDNLYSEEIAGVVGDAVKEGLCPDATAKKIADFARVRALDRKHQSPFSKGAQEAGFTYYGGKLDDLTVVVSFVSI
ncbi:hypothetical protein ACS0TY_029490 [Phlomoides rotata]